MRWQVMITCHKDKCDGQIRLQEFDDEKKANEYLKNHVKKTTWCPMCGREWKYSGSDYGARVIPCPPE